MSTATRMHKNLSDNPENMLPMSSWWTVNGNCQTRKVMTHERHRQLSWKHQWTSRSPCVDICTFPLLYMLIHRIDLQTAQSSWLSVPGTFIEGFVTHPNLPVLHYCLDISEENHWKAPRRPFTTPEPALVNLVFVLVYQLRRFDLDVFLCSMYL